MNRNKDKNGAPEILWISPEAIGLTLEDCYEGQGVAYIRSDKHDQRVTELLKRNNEMLSEYRALKAANKELVEQALMQNIKGTILEEDYKRLQRITEGCRDDMHEPDEQDITAYVVGDHLDNACGSHISDEAVAKCFQEYVVILERDGHTERFNLANLIAIARSK